MSAKAAFFVRLFSALVESTAFDLMPRFKTVRRPEQSGRRRFVDDQPLVHSKVGRGVSLASMSALLPKPRTYEFSRSLASVTARA